MDLWREAGEEAVPAEPAFAEEVLRFAFEEEDLTVLRGEEVRREDWEVPLLTVLAVRLRVSLVLIDAHRRS